MQSALPKALYSGSLAKLTGLSADTIRHYEKIGILPLATRTQSGYRLYPQSAIERVRITQTALRLGFTLSELGDILQTRDAGHAPCAQVFGLAKKKLEHIRAAIAEMKSTQKYLQSILADWEKRMQRSRPNENAFLLQSLVEQPKQVRKRNHGIRQKRAL